MPPDFATLLANEDLVGESFVCPADRIEQFS